MWTLWKKNKKNPKTFNIYHEDFADKVEPVIDDTGKHFEVKGVKYYRFKQDTFMPYGRYKMLIMFIKMVDLRMTAKLLSAYLDKIEQNISGEKGQVNLTKVYEAIMSMRARLALDFESETVYQYASVIYFDDNENLYDYDKKANEIKIARWREADLVVNFFYMKPMDELFGLRNISKQDLADYTKITEEIIAQTSETTEP